MKYAQGFEIETRKGYQVLHVRNPWPGDEAHFRYALVPKTSSSQPDPSEFDGLIRTPVQKVIVTSTTHIPALEELGALDRLLGFPGTKYISSEKARARIENGFIKELGPNGKLNTEQVLSLQPDLVIGYGMGPDNRNFETLQRASIPVLLNGDWMEKHPLGKAEWIRFFGALLGKEREAQAYFDRIEKNYLQAKTLVKDVKNKPSVLSGAVFKDVWYAPAGDSWAAAFLEEAGGNYLWEDEPGTGSLNLSLEAALAQGIDADVWIAPSQFTSYREMQESSKHYQAFKSFQQKKVYTFAKTKGISGGVLYYELAPYRPDAVLMDLIRILHPDHLPDHKPFFFHPLDP